MSARLDVRTSEIEGSGIVERDMLTEGRIIKSVLSIGYKESEPSQAEKPSMVVVVMRTGNSKILKRGLCSSYTTET